MTHLRSDISGNCVRAGTLLGLTARVQRTRAATWSDPVKTESRQTGLAGTHRYAACTARARQGTRWRDRSEFRARVCKSRQSHLLVYSCTVHRLMYSVPARVQYAGSCTVRRLMYSLPAHYSTPAHVQSTGSCTVHRLITVHRLMYSMPARYSTPAHVQYTGSCAVRRTCTVQRPMYSTAAHVQCTAPCTVYRLMCSTPAHVQYTGSN